LRGSGLRENRGRRQQTKRDRAERREQGFSCHLGFSIALVSVRLGIDSRIEANYIAVFRRSQGHDVLFVPIEDRTGIDAAPLS
jgi:hypothetical protein